MTLPFTGIATFAKLPLYDPGESPAPHVAILGIPQVGIRSIISSSQDYAAARTILEGLSCVFDPPV